MEIVEVVTFHLNKVEEVLEVSFRTNSDSEDVIREAKIPFIDISDFGYIFHEDNDLEILEEEEDDFFDEFEDDDLFVDENEVISFLNEYYILFIDKLPKSELF
jgi:hypothetical protein